MSRLQDFWRTLSPSMKSSVLFGPPINTTEEVLVEADWARELHELLQLWPGETPAERLERMTLEEVGKLLKPEVKVKMRQLLRRYPSIDDAEQAIQVIFENALNEMVIAKLEREMEQEETTAEKRKLARQIDKLRTEGAANAGGHVRTQNGKPEPERGDEGPPPTL